MDKPSLLKNLPFLITPPLLWVGNVIVARAVRNDIPPFTLSFGRWVISLLVLLPFAWAAVRRDRALYLRHKTVIAATAFTGIAAFNTLVYIGLHTTTSTNALLLNSCIPMLIMLIGVLFYGQRLNRFQTAGLLLALAGVLAVVLQGSLDNLLALRFHKGRFMGVRRRGVLGVLYAVDEADSRRNQPDGADGRADYAGLGGAAAAVVVGAGRRCGGKLALAHGGGLCLCRHFSFGGGLFVLHRRDCPNGCGGGGLEHLPDARVRHAAGGNAVGRNFIRLPRGGYCGHFRRHFAE